MWLSKKLLPEQRVTVGAFLCALTILMIACGSRGGETGADASQNAAAKTSFPLPAAGEADAWTPSGKTETFAGEGLYEHIDGGADIYLEYGFDELAIQKYNKGNEAVSLEVYRMSDPAAAFGIYTYNRNPSLSPAEVGNGGVIHSNGLFFWQDKYYVDIRQSGSASVAPEQFMPLAQAVSKKIGSVTAAGKPAVMELLPAEHMVPHSEVYARGRLGINNQVYVSSEDLFQLRAGESAAIARYHIGAPEFSVIIADYANDEESRSAYERFSEHFLGSSGEGEDIIAAMPMPGKHYAIGRVGKDLVVVANADSGDNALIMYTIAEDNIEKQVK